MRPKLHFLLIVHPPQSGWLGGEDEIDIPNQNRGVEARWIANGSLSETCSHSRQRQPRGEKREAPVQEAIGATGAAVEEASQITIKFSLPAKISSVDRICASCQDTNRQWIPNHLDFGGP